MNRLVRHLFGFGAGLGVWCGYAQAQPTNYVESLPELPVLGNQDKVVVVDQRFYQARNNGFLFTIGQGSGNNAGFSNRAAESFGSTTAQLEGEIEVQWGTGGATSVRVFFDQGEHASAPGHLYWSINIGGNVQTFGAVRQSTTGFYFYDDNSDTLNTVSGTAEVRFWQDLAYSQPYTVRSDAGWKEFFRSYQSITHVTAIPDGQGNVEWTFYRGQTDPNPLILTAPATLGVADGASQTSILSSDTVSTTYQFQSSGGTSLFTLRVPNVLDNGVTDISRDSSNPTAIEMLRGYLTDARRTETLDLHPLITAGESKQAFDDGGYTEATGQIELQRESNADPLSIQLPAWVDNIYLTNSPAGSLAIVSRGDVQTVDLSALINSLADARISAAGGQTAQDVQAQTASSLTNVVLNDNVFTFTHRDGNTQTETFPKWFQPEENDVILRNDQGAEIRWDDLIRALGTAQRNGRDSIIWNTIDSDVEMVFSPRGEAWTLTTTPSSGGNLVTISDNDSPPRTSSVLIPNPVIPTDALSITNVTWDSAQGGITLSRRGSESFEAIPTLQAISRVGDLVTFTLGGTAAPLSFSLPEGSGGGIGSTCDPNALEGQPTLSGNIITFPRGGGGSYTLNLSSLASGSSLDLAGLATLLNQAGPTTTINPSNFKFFVFNSAGNVNSVAVDVMDREFGDKISNSPLTPDSSSTASITVGASRRQIEIALAGIQTGGSGTSHNDVIEIVRDFTGQTTGTTNAPGEFASNRIPVQPATRVSVDTTNFDGNLASTDTTVQAVAQKVDDLTLGSGGLTAGQVDARIKPFARAANSTDKMPTVTLAQPTSTLGGSAIDDTNDRILVYDSSASDYAQSSINEFAEALKTPLANRLTPDPSGYTSSDDGTFPAWDTDRWTNGGFLNTNGFSWTFDTSTDDWSVNYTRGPPSGGTSGQVLSKASGTDYDYEWTTPATGGAGLSAVSSDSTLAGAGTPSSLLRVARPFTQIDEEKLDNLRIETRDLFETTFTVGSSTPGQWGENNAQTGFGLGAADSQFSSFGSVASSSVTIDGTTHTLYAVIENSAQDEIIVYISGNPNLSGYELEIGESFLAFNQAYENLNTTDTGEAYSIISWHANDLMPASGTADVDLAINRKINENDYLPDDGANGQILAWASGQPDWIVGTSRLIPVGGGVNQVLTKRSATDFDVEWRDAQGRLIPSGASLPDPASGTIGDQFRLVSPENVPQDHVLQAVQTDSQRRTIQLSSKTGFPHQVIAYAPALLGPNASLANKVYVVYNGAPSVTASNLVFHADKLTPQTYSISTSAPTGFSHWRQVTGLSYNDVQATHRYYVNVEFGDRTKLFPDRPYTLGLYVLTPTGWEFAPGTAAPWAVQGQPEPRTLLALTQLIDGPGTGITVASDNGITRTPGAPILFDPDGSATVFDLDDTDKQHGLLEVEAILSFTTRSPNTLGFDSTAIQTQRKTGFLFGSAVRASPVYSASAQNGVLVNSWQVYDTNGDVQVGDVLLYFSRNSNNELGYWFYYDPNAGSGARNFAISVNLETAFLHNDSPGRGIPAGGDQFSVLSKASGNDYDVDWFVPQSDWNEANINSISFIRNKPIIPIPAATWARAMSASGTAPVARLGTGTASATTYLRGDGTWQIPPTGSGGGLTTAQVNDIVESYTGQTADTPTSDFAISRIPTLTTNELPIWSGNYPSGQYRTGTAMLERDYDVVPTVGDLRNAIRGAGQPIAHPASGESNASMVSARNVSQAIENAVPLGGTAGQFLAKSTDGNYQTVWTNAPSGTIRNLFNWNASSSADPIRIRNSYNQLPTATGALIPHTISDGILEIRMGFISDTNNWNDTAGEFVLMHMSTMAWLDGAPISDGSSLASQEGYFVSSVTYLDSTTPAFSNLGVGRGENNRVSLYSDSEDNMIDLYLNYIRCDFISAGVDSGSGGTGSSTFLGLTDTPSSYVQNRYLGAGQGNNDLTWIAVPNSAADWARAAGASGTAPVARLGTGTASATTFLSGDGTWKSVSGGGGLTTAQVNTRIRAHTGQTSDTGAFNITRIPSLGTEKIDNGAVTSAKLDADTTAKKTAFRTLINAAAAEDVVDAFTGLEDTPADYDGQGGKYVAVKSAADGLEFVDAPSGSGISHDNAIEIIKDFTGQTGTTNAPGNFALANIPNLTTNQLPIWDGNYTGNHRTTTSVLERDYTVVATVGDLRNAVRGSGQAIAHPASGENNAQLVSARNVSQAIENAVPLGGTDGQVLTKTGSANYAVAWETPAGTAGTLADILDETVSATDIYFTDSGASGGTLTALNVWSGWQTVWTHTESTDKHELHFGHLNATPNTSLEGAGGGERVFVQIRGVQVNNSVETERFRQTGYLRNEQNVTVGSRIASIPISAVIDYGDGSTFRFDARVVQQTAPVAADAVQFIAANQHIRTQELGGGGAEEKTGLSDAEHTFPTLTASPGTLTWTDTTHSAKVQDDDLFGYSIILKNSSNTVLAKCNIPFGWGTIGETGTISDYRYLFDQSIGQARIIGRFIVGSGNGYKIDIDQIPATWSGRTIEVRNYGLN